LIHSKKLYACISAVFPYFDEKFLNFDT
jgi:hypothetical protein